MLTVPEASARILEHIAPLGVEQVPLLDSLGRVLAESVHAPMTLPAWDNSAMDGYAVRGSDIDDATPERPIRLRVLETIAAGAFPTLVVAAGEATRIMTGAPLPQGADTVIRVEDTDGGISNVLVRDARDSRRNIRPRGEDFREGDALFAPGTPIGPAQIGILASVGRSTVHTIRRPRVAIVGSGDELVDVDRFEEVLAGRKIVSSNGYTLHALIRATGGVPVDLGVAEDKPEALLERLRAAADCDLIITTAGISVGEFDYTRDVVKSLGADMKFWRVRMRPGAPLGFGLISGKPWIGLPGNPVSTMVTFELFVRPVVMRMLGHTRLFRRPLPVVLEEPIKLGAKLTHFLRAIVSTRDDGTATARLTGAQGSGILTSMALANALLIVPEDRPSVDAGETLHALPLGDGAGLTTQFAL